MKTDKFDNFAGIAQVHGRSGEARWFFHARSGHWEFHLVEDPARAPDCVSPQTGDYWEQGYYDCTQLTNQAVGDLVHACVRRYELSHEQRRPQQGGTS